MSIEEMLSPGEVIDNDRLCEVFQCSSQGGMRRSTKTNTLVLVSNHVKALYEDRWDDNQVMHYTGMGTLGDQSLEFMQNRTLAESGTNGVELHFFEVFEPKQYVYVGPVELAGEPYEERQPGEDGEPRRVWMFPLRAKVKGSLPLIDNRTLKENEARRARAAKKLSDAELLARAKSAPPQPGVQPVRTTQFRRDQSVAEWAKRRAGGVCQLCSQPGPFPDKDGEPYLETHHIIWLSRGGTDTPDNTVALCPNCHRRMHVVDSRQDIECLQAKLAEQAQ